MGITGFVLTLGSITCCTSLVWFDLISVIFLWVFKSNPGVGVLVFFARALGRNTLSSI